MLRLKADFATDLRAHARRVLMAEWGSEITQIDDSAVLIRYFDADRRLISARPRKVRDADDFSCPPDRKADWDVLKEKIRRGDDLRPHMSKSHKYLLNRDGLLNEWGVHHFHLGTVPDRRDPTYIARSGPVVFALVEDDVFLAINVYQHRDWEELSVIESLHRNWPEAIERYRLTGIPGENLTNTERRIVRQGGQAAVAVKDGTVYGSIGGPVSAAGTKYSSVRDADRWVMEVRQLQASLTNDLSPLMPCLTEAGHQGDEEIECELQIAADGRYQVFFPRYQRLVTLDLVAQVTQDNHG